MAGSAAGGSRQPRLPRRSSSAETGRDPAAPLTVMKRSAFLSSGRSGSSGSALAAAAAAWRACEMLQDRHREADLPRL
jgi:hypothetical protein